MDPGLVANCRRGEAVTQEQVVEALGKRAVLGAAMRQFFERYDLLLSPTMPIPAAYADPRDDGQPNPNNFPDWMPYTWPFNLTRNPSASIPCGVCRRTAGRAAGDRAAMGRSRRAAGVPRL